MAKTQAKSATRRRKIRRTVTSGQMHVQATFNNTIVSFTDERGNLLTWSSSGSAGFLQLKKLLLQQKNSVSLRSMFSSAASVLVVSLLSVHSSQPVSQSQVLKM